MSLIDRQNNNQVDNVLIRANSTNAGLRMPWLEKWGRWNPSPVCHYNGSYAQDNRRNGKVLHLTLKNHALENATDLQYTDACSCEGEGGCQNIFKNEEILDSNTNVNR